MSAVLMPAEPAPNRTGRNTSVVRARISPTMFDIHRAAAWWGGEGSLRTGKKNGSNGITASIAQKEIAVLEWLIDRFGGSISIRKRAAPHLDPCHTWNVSGPRARGFLMTIYACLPESPRRQQQIREALLATAEIKKRGPKKGKYCRKGHLKEGHKDCPICAKQALRAWRALPHNAEKHRKDERERYWRNPQKYREKARLRNLSSKEAHESNE